jgi:hypothetical protein
MKSTDKGEFEVLYVLLWYMFTGSRLEEFFVGCMIILEKVEPSTERVEFFRT